MRKPVRVKWRRHVRSVRGARSLRAEVARILGRIGPGAKAAVPAPDGPLYHVEPQIVPASFGGPGAGGAGSIQLRSRARLPELTERLAPPRARDRGSPGARLLVLRTGVLSLRRMSGSFVNKSKHWKTGSAITGCNSILNISGLPISVSLSATDALVFLGAAFEPF